MKLHYRKYGDNGPALVILHGLLGSLDNWQTLANRWASEMTVYTLDQRNHGRSPHSDDFSYHDMVGDLYEFCQDHHLDQIHLLGHSMGGKTAMHFALRYPERTHKLVVADMAPVAYRGGHEPIFDAMMSMPLHAIGSRQEAEEWLSGHLAEPAVRQFLLKNLTRSPGGGYAWKINLEGIAASYREILGFEAGGRQFRGPVLFLRGERSPYVREEDLPAYRQIFPAAFLRTLPRAGHWLHAEQPDLFYGYVREFLMQAGPSRLAGEPPQSAGQE